MPRLWIGIVLGLLIFAVAIGSWIGGYCYGRKFGDIDAYGIGFEQGQADGISTAQAAYESGGKIVNLTTGDVTQKPK
jgi:hypothetical protein